MQLYYPNKLKDKVIENCTGSTSLLRKEWVVSWFKNNMVADFLFVASQISPSQIATSQTNRIPLYGTSLNHMETYLTNCLLIFHYKVIYIPIVCG